MTETRRAVDPPVCRECGRPFVVGDDHPCTMDEAAMVRSVLATLTVGWQGERIARGTVTEALAFCKDWFGKGWAGGTGPHRPWYRCDTEGVAFGPTSALGLRLSWQQVVLILRGGPLDATPRQVPLPKARRQARDETFDDFG